MHTSGIEAHAIEETLLSCAVEEVQTAKGVLSQVTQ